MFQLKNIRYKDVLDIEKLDLPGGEITGLVGESGSGKTTLLKLLNRMITPDAGDILYKGESILDLSPLQLRREAVMLTQNPVIFPGTLRDNLQLGRRFSEKTEETEAKLLESLARVKLEKSLDDGLLSYSGGEKQRVALARILLMEPEVILADEPTSALDKDTERKVIEGLLDYVRQEKKTLIIVSHSPEVVGMLGGRIIELEHGRIKREREMN